MDPFVGTFTATRTKEQIDFWIKVGMPKEEALKSMNSHWTFKTGKRSNGIYVTHVTCEECPEMNTLISWAFGKTIYYDEKFFGGKVKATVVQVGENKLHVTMELDAKNSLEWYETYTDEGVTMAYKHSASGTSFEDVWKRWIPMTGTYAFHKDENLKEYLDKSNSIVIIDETYKTKIEQFDNSLLVTDWVCGQKVKSKLKFDEESSIDFMGHNLKLLLTQTGPHQYTTVLKRQGALEEFVQTFYPDGMVMVCKHHQSGAVCTIHMKRTCDISGTFKLISYNHALHDMMKMIGKPTDLLDKVLNDSETRLIVEEHGLYYRQRSISKVLPVDLSFKLDEEFTWTNPITQDETVNIVTKSGNVFTCITKNPNYEAVTTLTFTPNFMIQSGELCGTGLTSKLIYERCNE